jgi:hypothetical protein
MFPQDILLLPVIPVEGHPVDPGRRGDLTDGDIPQILLLQQPEQGCCQLCFYIGVFLHIIHAATFSLLL